jgi:tetratricopeptide (TPR) repeat protein
LKIALDNGYMETALRAQQILGSGFPAEENERSFQCYEKAYDLAKKVGDISHQSWTGLVLAWSYVGMGNMNKAVLFAEESVALDRKAGNVNHLSIALSVLGIVYQILGEWGESERCHKEASSISQGVNDWQAIWADQWADGWLNLEKGEYAKARELLEKACEVCEKAGAKSDQFSTSRWLIWTYIELGETEKADKLIDDLQKFALEVNDKALIASRDALKATLFRARKEWKNSLELFEKSVQEFDALDARRWDVYLFARWVLCEYARTYLERDREGDRERADKLLNQALEIFQKVGAKKEIEKIIAKKKLLTS